MWGVYFIEKSGDKTIKRTKHLFSDESMRKNYMRRFLEKKVVIKTLRNFMKNILTMTSTKCMKDKSSISTEKINVHIIRR